MIPTLTAAEKTKIIIAARWLIPVVAKRDFHHFPLAGFTIDEMYRIGESSMVVALKTWDPDKARFENHAWPHIKYQFIAATLQRNSFLHISKRQREYMNRLKKHLQKINKQPSDIDPNDPSIQTAIGLNAKQIQNARFALMFGHRINSLEMKVISETAELLLKNTLPSTQSLWSDQNDSDNPEDIYSAKQIQEQLPRVFENVLLDKRARLNPKERHVLRLVYIEGYNQANAGRLTGETRANISIMIKNAFLKIRCFFESFH